MSLQTVIAAGEPPSATVKQECKKLEQGTFETEMNAGYTCSALVYYWPLFWPRLLAFMASATDRLHSDAFLNCIRYATRFNFLL